MKIESWNAHEIRFVEHKGEWWAVLKDVSEALGLSAKEIKRRLEDEVVSNHHIYDTLGRKQDMLIVNEYGIYETIFSSRKPEAKQFKKWVYKIIKELREASGLKGFEIFRMLDKEHQKEQMRILRDSLRKPVRVDFIKANTVANKAISNKYGYPKMIKKGQMSPAMLVDRENVLSDVVELMGIKDKYNLDISVSKSIYETEG